MKGNNFIVIQGWMCNELELKGNELLIYALIYGFSQDGKSVFSGSRSYIAETFNISLPTVDKAIKNLLEKELIEQLKTERNGVIFNDYKTLHPIKKLYTPYKETLHHNIDIPIDKDIIKNNINTTNFLGSVDEEKKKPKKPNLYEKCIGVINDFTDDLQVRALLVDYLKFLLALNREKGNVLYVNVFKGKLNKLKDFDRNDWKEIIKQTLDNGWQGFFELKSNSTGKFNDTQNMKNYYADSEYIAEQEEWLRGLHGKTQF